MNNTIFYFFHTLLVHHAWLGPFVWFFAVPFIYIVIISVGIYFLITYKLYRIRTLGEFFSHRGREVFLIFFSAGISYAIAAFLKKVFHTARPFTALPNVHPLFLETDFAFPSGHSATIAALAGALFFENKKLSYLCMVATLLIGVARVMAGVHFPLDIVGGYAIGILVAFFVKSL